MDKHIKRALISVYYKDGIEPLARKLNSLGVELISTGGTYDFITRLGIPCRTVEEIANAPAMLHGRVKTLNPTIFGGILAQRDDTEDIKDISSYSLPLIDLVVVDLYPFEETVATGASEEDIIEKIDIGGISLIRAAAKNHKDVVIIPSRKYYGELLAILEEKGAITTAKERLRFAKYAFAITSLYDTAILRYFDSDASFLRIAADEQQILRYGENPHQRGYFFGDLQKVFDKIQGKELSYNNLQDIDAALQIIQEFTSLPTFAILKHTNPCGLASATTLHEAWKKAFAADPESAFGGILIANRPIDKETAESIGELFFEVLIAPDYAREALEILSKKTNRILLISNSTNTVNVSYRSALGGILMQEYDQYSDIEEDCQLVTDKKPSSQEIKDCLFAQRIVKHCKSNAIAIVKDQQLLASGVGQTSRIAALKQAIEKAKKFGFTLQGASLGSDAFFPFSDCVEVAANEGISAVIQPGGSIRDKDSIEKANELGISMLLTGKRHFKH